MARPDEHLTEMLVHVGYAARAIDPRRPLAEARRAFVRFAVELSREEGRALSREDVIQRLLERLPTVTEDEYRALGRVI